ncbi:MAG: hypothetical protein M3362_06870 [Acidobacteriota bacterium]|nr:hypothetical protein [Acidobacteriota bacterium]
MSPQCIFKYSAAAASVQLGLLILSIWFYYAGVFLYIYWPWVWIVLQLEAPPDAASHAMGGAYILGGLIGLVGNSIIAGVVTCLLKGRRIP